MNIKTFHFFRIWVATKIKWLRPYILTDNEIEKLHLLEIKSCFNFFGFDFSDMTELDIKKGMSHISKAISQTGLTSKEFMEAFNNHHLITKF